MNSEPFSAVAGLSNVLLAPVTGVYLIGLWLGYHVLVVLYNISPLHPLWRFPGPRLAAASYLYEVFYDLWLGGRYTREIRRMHEQYGPVVRINPDELHCNDPYFADEIYAGPGRIRDKFQHQLNNRAEGAVHLTTHSTANHELHRLRKSGVAKYFSRQQMLKLEGEVREFAQLTTDKMLRWAGRGPFEVKDAFNCFTADIISQYAFGEPIGFLAQEAWEPNFATWVHPFLQTQFLMRHSALVRKMGRYFPMLAGLMGREMRALTQQTNTIIPGYVTAALADPENGRVFSEVAESKTLPASEKSVYRLSGEGFDFLLAGTETTAAVLTILTYHLVAQPAVHARLMQEMEGLDFSNLKYTELEQLPFMWAIVHECLRMMPGLAHRSSRIARDEDLAYRSQDGKVELVIPRGIPIGMTSMINHWDERLFPEPDAFRPERWLVDGQPNYKLLRFLMAFGKGSRSCLGENLAYCEIYLLAALMAIRVIPRASLYETTLEDVSYDHDCIVVETKKGSVSTRITIS